MGDLDLDALEKIAREATPGPWEALGRLVETVDWSPDHDGAIISGEVVCMAYCYGGSAKGVSTPENAEHIAAFNPETALALIEEVKRSRHANRVTENSVAHVKSLTTTMQNSRESLNNQRREYRKLLKLSHAERVALRAKLDAVRALVPKWEERQAYNAQILATGAWVGMMRSHDPLSELKEALDTALGGDAE